MGEPGSDERGVANRMEATVGGAPRGTAHAALQGDPAQPQCGFTVVEPPHGVPIDPCLAGPTVIPLYGPKQVTRESGAPGELAGSFDVPASGGVCLRVANDGAAAAWIDVDGDAVLSPDDFNPQAAPARQRGRGPALARRGEPLYWFRVGR